MTVMFLHILASEEVCSGQLAADPESVRIDGVLMPVSDSWRSNLSPHVFLPILLHRSLFISPLRQRGLINGQADSCRMGVESVIHCLKQAWGLCLIPTSLLGFCLTWTTGYWREEEQMAWYR